MIYLIQNNLEDTFKIGYTNNVKTRLNSLQTGNSTELILLKVIEGTMEEEKKLHDKFKDFKILGEWFSFSEDILNYFNVHLDELESGNIIINNVLINKMLTSDISKSDLELFFYLVKCYSKNKIFTVTDYIKEIISKSTGKNKTSYNNSVRALLKHKMIFAVSEGSRSYKINPRYAFEGSSKLRNKAVIEMVSQCKDC